MALDRGIACSHVDKKGVPFEVGACLDNDHQCMLDMYEAFSPKACSQGLPPACETTRHQWVDRLYRQGINILARCQGRVVGHAGLMPDLARNDAEFLVFVDQEYRDRGVGTQLTALAIEKARQMGLDNIWLTVETFNFRAIAVYKKFGFVFCDDCRKERTMILDLTREPKPGDGDGA